MKKLIYATGNNLKFALALSMAKKFNVELQQRAIEIDEIQSEDAKKIALDKSAKAFSILNTSVLTSDDSWSFNGLRGFPGVYMKSMNQWLSSTDFLRLTSTLEDKSVILTQTVVYRDTQGHKIFSHQNTGTLLEETRGSVPQSPNQEITVMDGDGGKTIAQIHNMDDMSGRKVAEVWQEFFEWLIKQP